ncbi:ABC transporter ATP-binding protein [Aestuariibacter sp. AA17]|uniref:ABC transporter ATP-binding protein n=1 Tax=Fluctibacter corallii TaxID=2984329 RepID=A0ABT3ABC5_9ALTE|nr:ABC transporter ATP-binding protein [Aestuariibacter sp. AA17]MCV2885981.1 ABC transporter ATP-binding protein [Aestuariibacter sp. AA17]
MISLHDVSIKQRVVSVTGSIPSGHSCHILGPNGAGKSTLLSLIAGLLIPDTGQVLIRDAAINTYSVDALAQFRCFQQQQQNTAFNLTVKESVSFFGQRLSIPDYLEHALEIHTFMHRPINQLSGGEMRRVQILRCLLQVVGALERGEALVLLDEPCQGLDYRHQLLLFELFAQLTKQGNTLIISHHDLNHALHYADTVWLMKDGGLHASGNTKDVLDPLRLSEVFSCHVQRFDITQDHALFQTCLE